ncbi:hypothetical protein D8B34_11585 [Verminephrobacter eiseniae]|nr:hypothetical protein [Verminephrobacter eiseniae]MCW5292299.1 hypothetical protein [Verminephrobacter eiseniae]MCW8183309.1 hypothetical protein [Verminephrobacter eiseniae]MCW8223123.1 hypothetical protein [Verminephrobacter eiseniae]MCW8234388.1 hypothetical protein [Verminephrobacter eiseniae]
MSRHRSSVGLRWPSKRIAALQIIAMLDWQREGLCPALPGHATQRCHFVQLFAGRYTGRVYPC